MSKIIDDFKAALEARADQTGDGKLTMADVNTLAARAKAQLAVVETKFPVGVAVGAAIIGGAVALAICALL